MLIRTQYSMRSIFEAIVNAVVHRDYSLYGSKIRLFMYSDRIEIYSPGRLANTLTVDNLIENQVTRNEMLARLLSELAVEDDLTPTINRSHFLEHGVKVYALSLVRASGSAVSNQFTKCLVRN